MENKQELIISHGTEDDSLEQIVKKVKERIQKRGDLPYVTVERQLEILHELTEFPLGQFLLQNKGLDGYWTDYVVSYPQNAKITGKDKDGRPVTALEKYILDNLFLLTQERAIVFKQLTQPYVRQGVCLASVPCGLMRDLLSLDFSGIADFQLLGADLEVSALEGAAALAEAYHLESHIELIQCDAWQLPWRNRCSLLTSNGLTTYVSDARRVFELYQVFYDVLIPGGVLITAFILPRGYLDWNRGDAEHQQRELQRQIIFSDVIGVGWGKYQTSCADEEEKLKRAGFRSISFTPVPGGILMCVVAKK